MCVWLPLHWLWVAFERFQQRERVRQDVSLHVHVHAFPRAIDIVNGCILSVWRYRGGVHVCGCMCTWMDGPITPGSQRGEDACETLTQLALML